MTTQLFRANVGIILTKDSTQALMFERRDAPGAWQFPQGGLDKGEEPLAAAYRELFEETGLRPQDVALLGEYPEWLTYELPEEFRRNKGGIRGQTQRWFILTLLAGTDRINLAATDQPEFTNFQWVTLDAIESKAIAFRKPIYRKLADFIANR